MIAKTNSANYLSIVAIRGAGCGAMQCFTHFKKAQTGSDIAVSDILHSVQYRAEYTSELRSARRFLSLKLGKDRTLLSHKNFSFMVPATVKEIADITASLDHKSLPFQIHPRTEGRSEIIIACGAVTSGSRVMKLEFTSPSMLLGNGDASKFLADFLIFDCPLAALNVEVKLPKPWKFVRSLPTSRLVRNAWLHSAALIRPNEQQLLCFAASRI